MSDPFAKKVVAAAQASHGYTVIKVQCSETMVPLLDQARALRGEGEHVPTFLVDGELQVHFPQSAVLDISSR